MPLPAAPLAPSLVRPTRPREPGSWQAAKTVRRSHMAHVRGRAVADLCTRGARIFTCAANVDGALECEVLSLQQATPRLVVGHTAHYSVTDLVFHTVSTEVTKSRYLAHAT